MAVEQYYGTGRRKSSVARVYLRPGEGQMTVNKKSVDDYFRRTTLKMIINQPLEVTETVGRFDILVNVHGGGLSGQAGAIRHGIAKALQEMDEELRPILKKAKMLTRDARQVERKKYGQPGARKQYQFSKR
jgi:small subunit ribosomal protein S9